MEGSKYLELEDFNNFKEIVELEANKLEKKAKIMKDPAKMHA